MNLPVNFNSEQPITMSSRDIAELLEKRHDDVKRSINRLAEKGVIVQPPMADEQEADKMGRSRVTKVYHLEKRDSYVVVAQLSPEFTARLVDRWQELEEAAKVPALPNFADPVAAARAWADQMERNNRQAAQISDMREDVEAHALLTKAEGSLNITEAAKNLGIRPKDLFDYLSKNGWIYKRPNSSNWLGFQLKCNQGLLEHKTTTVTRSDGSEKITEQVRVTAKGLSKLAKAFLNE